MSCFSKILQNNEEYEKLSYALSKNRVPMGALGLSHINKVHLLHSLCEENKKCLAVTPDEATARRMVDDLLSMGSRAYLYPARDFSFSVSLTNDLGVP